MYEFGVDCEPFVPTIRKMSALSPAIVSESRAWPVGFDDDRAVGRATVALPASFRPISVPAPPKITSRAGRAVLVPAPT